MTRWTRRLLVGAIAILVPALAGCEAGLDAPTLQFHPASYGVSTTVNGIVIDNLFVLGPSPGETLPAGGQAGVFVSLEAYSSDRLESAAAPGTASSVQLLAGPITLNQDSLVHLSGPHPTVVLSGLTKPLSGGETVQLTLNFANAGRVTLGVPVEPAAYDFATFAPPPAPTATAAAAAHRDKGQAKTKVKTKVKVTADLASPTASASPSATP